MVRTDWGLYPRGGYPRPPRQVMVRFAVGHLVAPVAYRFQVGLHIKRDLTMQDCGLPVMHLGSTPRAAQLAPWVRDQHLPAYPLPAVRLPWVLGPLAESHDAGHAGQTSAPGSIVSIITQQPPPLRIGPLRTVSLSHWVSLTR